jgi:diamine N-acetyltransferase
MIQGANIQLRALEDTDLEFLYALENDTDVWEVSATQTPFSKYVLKQYLDNAHRDIYEVKQLRLIIETLDKNHIVGCIDLFEFNPQHHRVGVGLVIFNKDERGKGYGSESLKLIVEYAFTHLQVHQLFANITADNSASITLFENQLFEKSGLKKEWIFSKGNYKDELIYQCFSPKLKGLTF